MARPVARTECRRTGAAVINYTDQKARTELYPSQAKRIINPNPSGGRWPTAIKRGQPPKATALDVTTQNLARALVALAATCPEAEVLLTAIENLTARINGVLRTTTNYKQGIHNGQIR